MHLLFDTHPLLWALAGNDQFSSRAEAAARAAGTTVYVSEVSLREIAERSAAGQLHLPEGWLEGRREMLQALGFVLLPQTAAHRHVARRLRAAGGDGYDQLLGAQVLELATRGEAAILARDAIFEQYGIRRIW